MSEENLLLDAHSLQILAQLQRDARLTVQQLSDAVGLSSTPCWKRVKDMEAAGVIHGYTTRIDREKIGLHLACVVEINLSQHTEELVQRFERAVMACPQIVRCSSTTGQADYILTVVAPDIKQYERFLHDTLFKLPGVAHVCSSIVLKEIKSEVGLPIEQVMPPSPKRSKAARAR